MKTKITEKISPIIDFLKKQKLLSSLIICLSIFMVYFAISGFNIISGNDDYVVFKLINYGNIGISCLGFFFTGFISLIQPLFGNLNSYMIVQELICFISLLIINYVFLSALKGRTGLFFAIVFDIVYFSFIPLNILYSYTAIIACTAGLALLVYASMFEKRKKLRIIQEVLSFLLIITGSQIRFAPFAAVGAVFFAFAVSVLLASFIKNKKGNTVKKSDGLIIKKYLKTGLLVVIAAIIALGADVASTAVKHTLKGYDEMDEYYTALSAINDYDDTNFFMDKDFYKSIGIMSISDYSVLRHWFIDEDFYTVDKLRAIAENSQKNNTLSNKKSIFESVLNPISNGFSEAVNNGIIFGIGFVLSVLVFSIVVSSILLPSRRSSILRLGSFVVLWCFLFVVAKGFNVENMLIIPLVALTIYISFRYDNYIYLINLAISLAVIVLYCYMMTYRLYLHVTTAFALPAFVFMVLALGTAVPIKVEEKKKLSVAPIRVTALLLVACSVVSAVILFLDQPFTQTTAQNISLKQYINDNPDKIFLINQITIAKDYYEPFVLSEEPTNIMNYGLWLGKSGYMKNTRERNGIKHVFKDSINSNVVIPLFEPRDVNGVIASKYSGELSEYYNNHYAQKGETISLKFIERVGDYSIYKIVSEKNEKEKQ
ncbi:MAG: hypothetical protein IJ725_05395, partial [Ruminococcus sp.]|nr:hypothetical protein [Ruminococcus sp.]